MENKYKFRDSSLSFDERVKDLLSRLTIEEKAGLMSNHMAAVPRLDIGEWYVGAEVARGYVSRNPDEPTTVFPQPIGLSGTFDTELMEKAGLAAGKEARVLNKRHPSGHLMLWGPTVDLCRNPLWGRNEEGYGEDPFLTGEMSAAYTKGLADRHGEYYQSIPTLKHFCANNTENERGTASSDVEPRTLNEYYYAAFERPITCGGAYSIMAAYNELSGVPAVINPDIQNVLKDKWGLGFVVTDGGDFSQNVVFHGYSTSHAETIALAIKNGTDVLTDCEDVVAASVLEAVKSGLVSEKDIDKALYNSMLARFRLGEFDEKHPFLNPYVDPKCNWALNHMELFPLEINRATKEELLRIPGVGVRSVQRILAARRVSPLSFEDLKKLGVVLKRAQYFITCKGKHLAGLNVNPDRVLGSLISERCQSLLPNMQGEQLSLFDNRITREDVVQCLHGQM